MDLLGFLYGLRSGEVGMDSMELLSGVLKVFSRCPPFMGCLQGVLVVCFLGNEFRHQVLLPRSFFLFGQLLWAVFLLLII